MAEQQSGGQRRRRRLTPQEKYQVWQEVVAGQGTQREIADRWGVDRSTVTHIVKLAKQGALERLATSRPGRPGKSSAELALEDAQAEIERLKSTVTEQAVELHLFRKRSLGLTAGPIPTRVEAGIKEGLLELVDHAVANGWSVRRACQVLEVGPVRLGRWRERRGRGLPLDDRPPGPVEALHGLLDWERDAILELFDGWAEVDRSHRKLAHRGSRLGSVFVSESTVLRVLQAEDLILPAPPARDPAGPKRPWPEWVE